MRDQDSKKAAPGRPREFDKVEALSKIMRLFWEHGYEATGLSDIIKATGLGKASLYAAFGNKQAMYLAALTHYEDQNVDAAVHMLRSGDIQPLGRLTALLSAPIVAVSDDKDFSGCFLCNASADRASLDSDTGARVRVGYEKMRAAIRAALNEAFPDKNDEALHQQTELILTVYTGLRIMARSRVPVEHLQQAKNACLGTLSN